MHFKLIYLSIVIQIIKKIPNTDFALKKNIKLDFIMSFSNCLNSSNKMFEKISRVLFYIMCFKVLKNNPEVTSLLTINQISFTLLKQN